MAAVSIDAIRKIREKKLARDIAAGCTTDRMREIATERGGECLSPAYIDSKTPLHWRCGEGHEWWAVPSSIRAGTWCPVCSRRGGSVGERTCRAILEQMFGVPFRKCRPKWLVGPSGARLELDGYAEDRKIAFEYHGGHHYQTDNRTTLERLLAQQERDDAKRRLCFARGVSLIVVPEFREELSISATIDQIEAAVLFSGLRVPRWKRPSALPLVQSSLDRVFGPQVVADMRRIAAEKGGALLSERASRAHDPLLWQCALGHQWETRATRVTSLGYWCVHCSKVTIAQKTRQRARDAGYGIELMQQWAAQRGGRCLSETYEGSTVPLRWQCAAGHEFTSRPNGIQSGSWCGICARQAAWARRRLASPPRPKPPRPKRGDARRGNLAYLARLATARGGTSTATLYLGSGKPHPWRCSFGHEWEARPNSVQQGKWCPFCSGRRKPA